MRPRAALVGKQWQQMYDGGSGEEAPLALHGWRHLWSECEADGRCCGKELPLRRAKQDGAPSAQVVLDRVGHIEAHRTRRALESSLQSGQVLSVHEVRSAG